MGIASNLQKYLEEIGGSHCKLVAISKTMPEDLIMEAYRAGQRIFGENRVQELVDKQVKLPQDIQWHMVGHLQSNKVKYIAPFVSLIHSVDSLKLAGEINKQAARNNRIIPCLLQVHIAEEETKFGLSEEELGQLMEDISISGFKNIKIVGLMGMATFTDDEDMIRREFRQLKLMMTKAAQSFENELIELSELSMGMSGDYRIAIEEGSTLIRVGTGIFGARH